MKSNEEGQDEKNDRAVLALKDLTEVRKSKSRMEQEQFHDKDGPVPTPEIDLENALKFIELKEAGGDVMQVEDANYFKKLDNMLPEKWDEKNERAEEMVKMLGWLGKKEKI